MAPNPRRRPAGLVRSDPFDGLTPLDFLAPKGTWPDGPFVRVVSAGVPKRLPPDELAEAQRAAAMVEAAVGELAEEVREYLKWKKWAKLSASEVARQAAVSRARIAAFEHGENWPRWDLLMRLRVLRDRSDWYA